MPHTGALSITVSIMPQLPFSGKENSPTPSRKTPHNKHTGWALALSSITLLQRAIASLLETQMGANMNGPISLGQAECENTRSIGLVLDAWPMARGAGRQDYQANYK